MMRVNAKEEERGGERKGINSMQVCSELSVVVQIISSRNVANQILEHPCLHRRGFPQKREEKGYSRHNEWALCIFVL